MFNFLTSPLKKYLLSPLKGVPEYGIQYFDHLLGLYDASIEDIKAPHKQLLDEIKAKRDSGKLQWKDIYSFDLILVKDLKIPQLKSRIRILRLQFQTVAGQKNYDVYLASKPPDLATETDELLLRQDIEYLLNEFYLRYSLISAREHLRSNLLKLAAFLTTIFLIVGAVLYKLNSIMSSDVIKCTVLKAIFSNPGISTISVVVFAGIIGAFISMQQRIQSAPSEGDPVYNFSVLTQGIFGIFLSPVSGAIFAVILYLLFAGGILQGTAFPVFIKVPGPKTESTVQETSPKEQPPATGSPGEPRVQPPAQEAPQAGLSDPVKLGWFMEKTGPASGTDFALLIIWAFIAGFAERFVPDALNRMVTKSESQSEKPT